METIGQLRGGRLESEKTLMQVTTTLEGVRARLSRSTRREWLSLIAQIGLVVGIELGDDLAHGMIAQSSPEIGLVNAIRVVHFEAAHGFWVEPGVQSFFEQTHSVLGIVVGWAQVMPIFNAMYGLGHMLITLFFAMWVFSSADVCSTSCATSFCLPMPWPWCSTRPIALAPPRLAGALPYDGHPFHFLDPVFGSGGGVKLSFNEFAAMPSLHVGWALIVGLTLFWTVKSVAMRVLALIYPLIMLTTVVVTGNHYIADGLGAAVVLSIAFTLSLLIEWWRGEDDSLVQVIARFHALRYQTSDESALVAPTGRSSAVRQAAA